MDLFSQLRDDDVLMDSLPDDVAATIEIRDSKLQQLGFSGGEVGLEFLVSDLRRWLPGKVIKVAFLDGDSDLHLDIKTTVEAITEVCGLVFDFGEDARGGFRRWTEQDTEHAADIRVSFDKQGYFSLVGIDSIDPAVGPISSRVGGRPHQASLNLGGFAVQRPATWRGTTLHEFLHAVGFHHSHQNMRGPCQESFRWDDDQGYQLTKDVRGAFIADHNGKRPGIYTYLAGFPNFWQRAKVDHNLRTENDPNLVAGPFDQASCMLYRFPPLFYRTVPSKCAPTSDGQALSDGDVRGLRLLYPDEQGAVDAIVARQDAILSSLESALSEAERGNESVEAGGLSIAGEAVAAVRASRQG